MNQAKKIAKYLKARYSEWTADPMKPGDLYRMPYLKWNDFGARDAYYLVVDLWKLPREA